MKTKILLPVLAIVLAIGMSFAFVNATEEDYYASGFIQIGTEWHPVDVNCNGSSYDCKVQISGSSTEYLVYSTSNPGPLDKPLKSSTQTPEIIPDPRD